MFGRSGPLAVRTRSGSICSTSRSRLGIQLGARWQFWKNTHRPRSIANFIISSAIGPYTRARTSHALPQLSTGWADSSVALGPATELVRCGVRAGLLRQWDGKGWQTLQTRLSRRCYRNGLRWVGLGPATIRYDTRCYFNVRWKANMSQLHLPHGTDN